MITEKSVADHENARITSHIRVAVIKIIKELETTGNLSYTGTEENIKECVVKILNNK